MRAQQISLSFAKLTLKGLLAKSGTIQTGMSDNPNFPDPSPSLKAIASLTNAFKVTLDATPSKANTLAKQTARAKLIEGLKLLGTYVIANSADLSIAATSEFDLTKLPAPVGILGKPESFKIVPYHMGSVKASLKKIYGADAYSFEYQVVGSASWVVCLSTKTRTIISGLTSGQQLHFRVAGIGANPMRIYSDVVTTYVI